MFENKEEGRRVLRMNVYYYLNELKMPIFFDIQKVLVDLPSDRVFPLIMYQENPRFAHIRNRDIQVREELSKHDPIKLLQEEKRKKWERAEAKRWKAALEARYSS